MHVLLERQCYEDERWRRSSIVGRNDCEPYRLAWGCSSASFLDGRTPNWKLIQYRLYTGRSNDKWWSTLELPAVSMKVQQPIVKTAPTALTGRWPKGLPHQSMPLLVIPFTWPSATETEKFLLFVVNGSWIFLSRRRLFCCSLWPQFSSWRYPGAWKSPYALHPISPEVSTMLPWYTP